MSIWNFAKDKHTTKDKHTSLVEKKIFISGLCTTFLLSFIAFSFNRVKASDALCYMISSDEVIDLEHLCREADEKMPDKNQNFPINPDSIVLSEEQREQIRNDLENSQYVGGPITASSGNPILERISEASPEEVIYLSDELGFPDGTYIQDETVHFPDGTVAENIFSPDSETRVILPDGSILMPGESHQVTEDYFIDLNSTGAEQ